MYESFFGLSGKPFSLLPDSDFLFFSKKHKHAINLLEYAHITQAGFSVISGEVGAGKTTIIHYYIKKLGDDVVAGLIANASKSFGRPMQWVAAAFGLQGCDDDDVKIYNVFIEFLLKQHLQGKRTLLIIDEAQNLTAGMLEDLRMLSNVNNGNTAMLQIILIGQPSLLATLKKPELQQLVQRVVVHCHLTPLEPCETVAYIRHRLKVAGSDTVLFDDKACAAIHAFTGGIPRLINLLCDQVLLYAFAEDTKQIDSQLIDEVVADRGNDGLSAFKNISPMQLSSTFTDVLREIKAPVKKPKLHLAALAIFTVCFMILGSSVSRADTDYRCLSLCADGGKTPDICLPECSYASISPSPHIQKQEPGSNHNALVAPKPIRDDVLLFHKAAKPKYESEDYTCLSQCEQEGMQYGLCRQKCIKKPDQRVEQRAFLNRQ